MAYNGTPYCGWQRQPNARSVQECVEEALGTLLKQPVDIVGCGRTDAGVHASCFYAHFDVEEAFAEQIFRTGNIGKTVGSSGKALPDEVFQRMVYQLNALLDKEISVSSVFAVPDGCHARFSALSRTYRYYLHTRKNPFLDDFSYYCRFPFDPEPIREAGRRLRACKDFTSFSKLHTQTKTNLCDLTQADFEQIDGDRWVFVFTANRFLRNMVRALVGTMLGVGNGRYTLDDLETIVQAKDRCRAGVSVPAHALFLSRISYPSEMNI